MRSPFAERERERLIEAILPDVPFDGWTTRALRSAASRVGIPPGEAIALFPRGAPDMIAEFSHWADRQMLARLEAALADGEPQQLDLALQYPHPNPPPPAGEGATAAPASTPAPLAGEGRVGVSGATRPHGLSRRVKLALNLRFEVLLPWREAVRRGLSVLAMPQNAPLGLRLLYDTVDAVWRGVGDHPTDFSYYTKRASLAGIQAAAMLYWLDDRSPGSNDTQEFIERRLAGLHRLTGLRERFAAAADTLPNPLRLLRPSR